MPDNDERLSIGELSRTIERGFADLKEDIHNVAGRLDGKVDQKVYEAFIDRVIDRVARIEAERQRDADRRTADRRAIYSGLIYPIVAAVILSIGAVVLAMYVALAKGS